MASFFEFRPDWYRSDEIRTTVLSYYQALRSVLQGREDLHAYLKRCCHCGIFFLTGPCNARRTDLRCPFGCSAGYRRQASAQRSVAYYRTETGKQKKRQLNRKRYLRGSTSAAHLAQPVVEPVAVSTGASILAYARMVTSLIERRWVSWEELSKRLEKIWRQHGLGPQRGLDYGVRKSKYGPP